MVTWSGKIHAACVLDSRVNFGQVDALLSTVQSSVGVKKGIQVRKI